MIKVFNTAIDSADWIEKISGKRPEKNVLTLKEFDNMIRESGEDNPINKYWDYSLDEIQEILFEPDRDNVDYQLVRFNNDKGDVIYRLCEIDKVDYTMMKKETLSSAYGVFGNNNDKETSDIEKFMSELNKLKNEINTSNTPFNYITEVYNNIKKGR